MPSDVEGLIENLKIVPQDAYLDIPAGTFFSTRTPVGQLCHEAADVLLSQHFNAPEGKAAPTHLSDCALHNGPAYFPAACDCGADIGMTPERYGSEFPSGWQSIETAPLNTTPLMGDARKGADIAAVTASQVSSAPTPSLTNLPASESDTVGELTLGECPEGLFLFDGDLGFKSEYKTESESSKGFWQSDAYCVGSGEYFWGGTDDAVKREKLLVTPVDEESVLALINARAVPEGKE